MNISNISAERFLLEISTNTICRELFFFNKQEVINAMEPYSKDWFENLTYAQCNKHAICIIKKLEDEVCKYYLNLNMFFQKEFEPLFADFFLCHRQIPQEPFVDYCVRFGKFYGRNSLDSERFSYVNNVVSYCLNRLIIIQKRFPFFNSVAPSNWKSLKIIIPPYILVKNFEYDINETIRIIKDGKIPTKKETTYLFSGIGNTVKIVKKPKSTMIFYSLCSANDVVDKILSTLKDYLSQQDYQAFVDLELPELINNKEILFSS